MFNLLFGWLIKPELMLTTLDYIIFYSELIIVISLLCTFLAIKETIKEKKENKQCTSYMDKTKKKVGK